MEYNGKKSKEKLDGDFYNYLFETISNNYVFSDDNCSFSKDQLKYLLNKNIIKRVSPIVEKYLNTKFEKFQIYLENIFSDASKTDYISNNKNKRVLFVGAGGICTAIIDYLISAGFIDFGFVDFDVVEVTNFNRQYKYNESDIGNYKVDSIKNNLNKQYSGLLISTYNKKIMSSEDLYSIAVEYNPDMIICAADTPAYKINKYIAEVSKILNVPCIFGGVGQNSGAVGPLLCKDEAFDNYIKKIDSILNSIEGIFPCKGSFGVTNSLISNYMARDIIFYLMGKKKNVMCLNKECIIDFDRNNIYGKEEY